MMKSFSMVVMVICGFFPSVEFMCVTLNCEAVRSWSKFETKSVMKGSREKYWRCRGWISSEIFDLVWFEERLDITSATIAAYSCSLGILNL